MPSMRRDPLGLGLPQWLDDILNTIALSPVSTAVPAGGTLKAGGKALADRLGEILSPEVKGTGLPKRMRLTSYDPGAGSISLTGADHGEALTSTAADFDTLLRRGAIAPELPPGAREGQSVGQMARRLRALLK